MPSTHYSGIVAIVGPPNAGKSTLLNHLLRQKIAIVTPRPQTTRNRITGIVTGADYQMVLLDTPGLHQAREEMNRQMMKAALASLNEADVVLFLLDCTDLVGKLREKRGSAMQEYLRGLSCPVVLALNKEDLLPGHALLPMMDWCRNLYPFAAIVPMSALKGGGVDRLERQLVTLLPEGPRYYPSDLPTDASERFIAAEIIREKIFLLTRDEIPYSTAVLIDAFEEATDGPVRITATILVERGSQKGILIGEKGRMLAAIRKKATTDIETLLDCRVQLQLWVKVSKNWTENRLILRELGLG